MNESKKLHAKIDQLLHDAEHKDGAIEFAGGVMGDHAKADEFRADRDALIEEAKRLDPNRTAPAWSVPSPTTSDEYRRLTGSPKDYPHESPTYTESVKRALGRGPR